MITCTRTNCGGCGLGTDRVSAEQLAMEIQSFQGFFGCIISIKSEVGPKTAAGKRNIEVTAFQRLDLHCTGLVFNPCLSQWLQ